MSSNTSSAGTGVGGSGGNGSGGNGSGGNGSGGNGSGGNGSGGMVGQVPSPGCSAAEPPASGRFSIDVEGTQREYILKLPESYQPAEPYRLIFAWHGLMYSADWVASGDPPATGPYFGIEAEAQGSAIFVAPQALSGGWSNQDGRDVAFLDAMLQVLLAELCIDESRIFSTGFSFGGIMTLTLGCERSETFRAIAPMSGSLRNDCPGNQPVAYWSSHGDVDMTITIAEGEMARDAFVERNGCSSETLEAEPAGCVSYQGCSEGHPVTWCVFSGAHEPPPFAGVAIWSFFEQF